MTEPVVTEADAEARQALCDRVVQECEAVPDIGNQLIGLLMAITVVSRVYTPPQRLEVINDLFTRLQGGLIAMQPLEVTHTWMNETAERIYQIVKGIVPQVALGSLAAVSHERLSAADPSDRARLTHLFIKKLQSVQKPPAASRK